MYNGALIANSRSSVFRLTVKLLHTNNIGHIAGPNNCVSVMQELSIGEKLVLLCIYPHERWDLLPFEIWNRGPSPSSDQGITILVNSIIYNRWVVLCVVFFCDSV